MLLVEFTINSTLHRISILGHDLDHAWKPRIISMGNVTWACRSNRGGYCPLGYGTIQFKPKLFAGDYPPPDAGKIIVKYTATTEAEAVTLFEGVAYCSNIADNAITYTLLPPEFDETLVAASLSTGTLASVLTTILTGISEITSVITSGARSPSPQVVPADYADRLNIDYASELAEAMCHMFYVVGSTAYLLDMKAGNGSFALTEHQISRDIRIERGIPIAEISRDDETNPYPRQSLYPYGRRETVHIPHNTQANIEAALDDILTVENKWRSSATIPLSGALPLPRQKITWTDYYLHPVDRVPVDISIYPIDLQFDFNTGGGWVTLSGDAEVTVP